jgi:hypothetical protein
VKSTSVGFAHRLIRTTINQPRSEDGKLGVAVGA